MSRMALTTWFKINAKSVNNVSCCAPPSQFHTFVQSLTWPCRSENTLDLKNPPRNHQKTHMRRSGKRTAERARPSFTYHMDVILEVSRCTLLMVTLRWSSDRMITIVSYFTEARDKQKEDRHRMIQVRPKVQRGVHYRIQLVA